MRISVRFWIFLALLAFSFIASPSFARASHCGASFSFSTAGRTPYFFDDYETFEYVNGFLVIHFRLKEPFNDGRAWTSSFGFLSDECRPGFEHYRQLSTQRTVSLTPGIRYFSVRFVSPTRFEIWNDEANAREICSGCIRDIPAFPSYYDFSFHGNIDFGESSLNSSALRILENAPGPPIKEGTLEKPAACASAFFDSSGYLFDQYEHAEYVNGLLNYHFRLRTPYNDGRQWYSALRFHDENCEIIGATNALDQLTTQITPHMRYYSVRFSSPTHYDIWNDDTNTIEECPACSVDIPTLLPGPTVYKYVSFTELIDPYTGNFLNSTPFPIADETTPVCCSNVAFLPGIQASRLYKKQIFENKLWEPNVSADVEKLYLDENGDSIDPDIYTRDIVDEAFGFNVYKKFAEFMDGISGNGKTIAAWEALPYDWRMAAGDVPNELLKLADGETYKMIDEIRRLAETSRTGKVTIIAHSNGGLVAKMLFEKLKNESDPLLQKIDKLVLVAAPQLGTPKAIAGLLHGDEQTLAKGFLLDKSTARGLAENMPSAYTLLPSDKYFTEVADPVIEFDPDVINVPELSNLAGTHIASAGRLHDFITGHGGAWGEPEAEDTDTPNVLKPGLLARATSTQMILDSWAPPLGTEVIQIAGWGLDTIRGIRYDDCDIPFCSDTLNHLDRSLLITQDGDGTVVVPSAIATDGAEKYYVNLPAHNRELRRLRRNRDHGSILETEEIQEFIGNIIQGNRDLPAHISNTKPPVADETKRLRFRLHSPVALHLFYDADGNHTGTVANPDPASDLRLYEEQIPNSYYTEFGETKYAGADTFATTTVRLAGEALGTFTFEIDEVLGDQVLATTTWSDVPVAASSTLTMDIKTLSTPTPLLMDVDGDGITDVSIAPGEGVSPQEFLPILRGIIKTLNLPDKKRAALIKAVDKLEKALEKEYKNEHKKKVRLEKAFDDLIRKIRKLEKKGILARDEANKLVEIIEQVKVSVIE